MPERFVGQVSGHSTRVGAIQDLACAGHRSSGYHPSRRLEVKANADAICGEDQCGELGHGKGGREDGEEFNSGMKERVQLWS